MPGGAGLGFFPRISSGSQFIRDYQGLDSSETFANVVEICLDPGSGLAKDVTAILGFEELIHPRGPVLVGMGIGAVQAGSVALRSLPMTCPTCLMSPEEGLSSWYLHSSGGADH